MTARGSEVIVALDFPNAESARRLIHKLPGDVWFKVGLELFTSAGPPFVRELVGAGHGVFLDLKLHDIPNTVAGAVRSVAGLGARLLTVHASGGEAMLRAAAAAAEEASAAAGSSPAAAPSPTVPGRLKILAVTVLTSMSDDDLRPLMGPEACVGAVVTRLAKAARAAGVDGVVASVAECRAIKRACGEDFVVATPGIRLADMSSHDQKRVATPEAAAGEGADYLVVGRAITAAPDPAKALKRVRGLLPTA